MGGQTITWSYLQEGPSVNGYGQIILPRDYFDLNGWGQLDLTINDGMPSEGIRKRRVGEVMNEIWHQWYERIASKNECE